MRSLLFAASSDVDVAGGDWPQTGLRREKYHAAPAAVNGSAGRAAFSILYNKGKKLFAKSH